MKRKDNGLKNDPNKLIILSNINVEVLIMILMIQIMKIMIMIKIINEIIFEKWQVLILNIITRIIIIKIIINNSNSKKP